MNQGFGMEVPHGHSSSPQRHPARYLVIIDDGGSGLARLFLENRAQVEAFDAGAEEVSLMTKGLVPAHGANGAEWDHALKGHSAAERRAASVYTLDV